MYSLKSTLKRGVTLSAAFALVVAAVAPVTPAFADSLNPLTERSLTLSSSSPGWSYTDGSGNSIYAPPNSGANGKKTGNYFSFRVSSDTSGAHDPIKAMSFQYCTTSAGKCASPGDNAVHGTDTTTTSDLNVVYPSATEVGSGDFATVIDTSTGLVKAVPGYTNSNPKYIASGGSGDVQEAAKAVTGNYVVMYDNAGTWTQSTGWTVSTANQENAVSGITGQDNTIVLTNATGLGIPSTTQMKVLFFANANNYITNPGSGAFFVKINTYSAFTALAPASPGPAVTLADNAATVIDGGVTVANMMNQSIQITTKVLETMQFSVGTVDPNTLTPVQLNATALAKSTHGTCDVIQTAMTPPGPGPAFVPQNVLELGNQDAESSLATEHTYATHSYWRLSSNSSAGATVYYSGHTLANTSGDEIAPIGVAKKTSQAGSEQFGLAIDAIALGGATTHDTGTYGVNYEVDRAAGKNYENAVDTNDTFAVTGVDDSQLSDLGAVNTPPWDYTALNKSYHTPRLDPLVPTANYGNGSGKINTDGTGTGNAEFAFDAMSDTVPTPIASEDTQVVDCVTAKMRYIGNIAATTPAGIYTTKINYIAAPQY